MKNKIIHLDDGGRFERIDDPFGLKAKRQHEKSRRAFNLVKKPKPSFLLRVSRRVKKQLKKGFIPRNATMYVYYAPQK